MSSVDYDSSYSQWKLTDSNNKSHAPVKSINLYCDNTAGSARTQYEFDKDPDSVLPAGVTYFATHIPSASTTYKDTGSFMRQATRDQQQQTEQLAQSQPRGTAVQGRLLSHRDRRPHAGGTQSARRYNQDRAHRCAVARRHIRDQGPLPDGRSDMGTPAELNRTAGTKFEELSKTRICRAMKRG